MEEEKLVKFIEWLVSNVDEFKNKSPEEVITSLNEMSHTEGGVDAISSLINQFKQNKSMFKRGGALSYLVNKLSKTGKSKRLRAGGETESTPQQRERGDYSKTTHEDGTVTYTQELPVGIRQTLLRPNGDRTDREITFGRDTAFWSYPAEGKGLVLNRGFQDERFNPAKNDITLEQAWLYRNTGRLMNKWGKTFDKYFPKEDDYLRN